MICRVLCFSARRNLFKLNHSLGAIIGVPIKIKFWDTEFHASPLMEEGSKDEHLDSKDKKM
jgi:hypothetical protein